VKAKAHEAAAAAATRKAAARAEVAANSASSGSSSAPLFSGVDADPRVLWTAAPKPMMGDSSYTTEFRDWDIEERKRRMHEYTFCINEQEIMFDAADCELIGDMMFVQQSMVTNLTGIRWLKRHFEPKGIQVHTMHFPYDLFPSHMDCTFVAVRPGLDTYSTPATFVCSAVTTRALVAAWALGDSFASKSVAKEVEMAPRFGSKRVFRRPRVSHSCYALRRTH